MKISSLNRENRENQLSRLDNKDVKERKERKKENCSHIISNLNSYEISKKNLLFG